MILLRFFEPHNLQLSNFNPTDMSLHTSDPWCSRGWWEWAGCSRSFPGWSTGTASRINIPWRGKHTLGWKPEIIPWLGELRSPETSPVVKPHGYSTVYLAPPTKTCQTFGIRVLAHAASWSRCDQPTPLSSALMCLVSTDALITPDGSWFGIWPRWKSLKFESR